MKPLVVCEHRTEIEGQIFCKKKKEFIKQPYMCSKVACKDHHFPTLAMITVPVGRCDECPFHYTDYTRGAGHADDYFCKAAGGRKIVGYVEYDSEIPPVPSWCPFYIKEVKKMDAEFVICKECIYWEDCPNKENHDGCYLGEKMEK